MAASRKPKFRNSQVVMVRNLLSPTGITESPKKIVAFECNVEIMGDRVYTFTDGTYTDELHLRPLTEKEIGPRAGRLK